MSFWQDRTVFSPDVFQPPVAGGGICIKTTFTCSSRSTTPALTKALKQKSESLSGETRYIQCRKGLNSYNMTYYPTRVYSWFFSFSPIVVFNGFSLKIVTCYTGYLVFLRHLQPQQLLRKAWLGYTGLQVEKISKSPCYVINAFRSLDHWIA